MCQHRRRRASCASWSGMALPAKLLDWSWLPIPSPPSPKIGAGSSDPPVFVYQLPAPVSFQRSSEQVVQDSLLYHGCQNAFYRALHRRDIAFLKRLKGRTCFLLTDQSPYPPGKPHAEQHHVGHHTIVWLEEEEEGEDGEPLLRVHGYTVGVFFTETTAAKANLACLEEAVELLARTSSILQALGELGQ
eukprot:gene11004-biopygen13244